MRDAQKDIRDAALSSRPAGMDDKDFHRLSCFIEEECGIKMPPSKKVMLESRLQKRLRMHGIQTFKEYCDFLFSPEGTQQEMVHMIDVVTTNKTDFFREPGHFEYLANKVLPELCSGRAAIARTFMVWSAGCSTGEEPYTLTMVLSEFKEKSPDFKFMILATDISTRVLDAARYGVYDEETVGPVPFEMKRKYLLRSKDRSKGLVRIIPELRSLVRFRRLNFMEGDFGMREPMDIIFCRNVIIYFDRKTQENLINRFCKHMRPGGHLFLGHSETINGLNVPLVQVAPTVYRRP
ncbi:MAG: chemotaxis protein CheR [Nitrospirae bacterium]|nr:MAG: chemotaxis protein CheR [Nitrospirota bacterium]